MLLEYNQSLCLPVQVLAHPSKEPTLPLLVLVFDLSREGQSLPALRMALAYTFAPSPTAIKLCFGSNSVSGTSFA